MHKFTNANGEVVSLPVIQYDEVERLDYHGVVDLYSLIEDPDKWETFFKRITSDRKFIIEFAYVLLHDEVGSDEQQVDFARSLFSPESGSACLLELSEALRLAVIDFFPPDLRDAIRQHWAMTVTEKNLKTIENCLRELDSTESDLAAVKSGSSQCSESSDTQEEGSASVRSVNDSTVQPITIG